MKRRILDALASGALAVLIGVVGAFVLAGASACDPHDRACLVLAGGVR